MFHMKNIDDVPFSHISLLKGNTLKPFKLFWGDFVGQRWSPWHVATVIFALTEGNQVG